MNTGKTIILIGVADFIIIQHIVARKRFGGVAENKAKMYRDAGEESMKVKKNKMILTW